MVEPVPGAPAAAKAVLPLLRDHWASSSGSPGINGASDRHGGVRKKAKFYL